MAHPQPDHKLSLKVSISQDINSQDYETKRVAETEAQARSLLSCLLINLSSSYSLENLQKLQTKCPKSLIKTDHSNYFLSLKRNTILRMGLPVYKVILFFNLAVAISTASSVYRARMVRLCIASVDPVKLSSQCVMCNRREFPLTVIDCTGISKMNDLIASPLSVQDATCLIYNCRRQVPDIKPEPYHGTAAVRANYPSASGIRSYEILPPLGMYGSYSGSHPISRYTGYGGSTGQSGFPISTSSSSMIGNRQQFMPFTFVPASSYATPFSKASSMDY